jgi:polysaccharide deacetylase 2 family uncharacterized protein YibQ
MSDDAATTGELPAAPPAGPGWKRGLVAAWTRFAPARRALGLFWAATVVLLFAAGGVLQWLGPPGGAPAPHATLAAREAVAPPHPDPAPPATAHPSAAAPSSAIAAPEPPEPAGPPRRMIAAPDPTLLEPAPDFPDGQLPRIGPGGRLPMRIYAAGAEPAAGRPRIAILLAGVGLSEQATADAIVGLPPPVSFAVSPYATISPALLDAARTRGHELFAAIPMEPQGYPVNDAGVHALLTGSDAAANARQLEWALSRFTGYAGATGALGHLRGERFSAAPGQMQPVLAELAARGLLYVDARPGAKPPEGAGVPPFLAIDVVIDEPLARADIDGKLARLEQIAGEHGFAIGLVGAPTQTATDRIAAWAVSLPPRGLLLSPVSALARPTTAAAVTPVR